MLISNVTQVEPEVIEEAAVDMMQQADGTVLVSLEREGSNSSVGETRSALLDFQGLEDLSTGIRVGFPDLGQENIPELSNTGGTILYNGSESDVSLAIQPVISDFASGMAVHTVIPNAESSHEYHYQIEGGIPIVNEAGGVDIFKKIQLIDDNGFAQEVDSVVSTFDAPWAVDAVGNSINTRYEVRGDEVIQIVEFSESNVFPVIADPRWWQVAISVTVGAAVGTAAAIALKIPNWGVAIGGCVTGAMNAMWDGRGFSGVFMNCILYGALGKIASLVRNTVTALMASRGFRV